MNKLLYIEDDLDFARLVGDYLRESGFEVESCSDGVKAMDMIKNNKYDAIICDLNLDRLNGKQIVELAKKYDPSIKIVIFTCSDDEYDELSGLRVGADDFITKSSSFEVLLERIRKVLKTETTEEENNENYLEGKKDEITVDVENRIVKKKGEIVELTKLELDLLIYFLKNKNILLSREKIYEDVWFVSLVSFDVDLRNIDAHVKNLRKKVGISSIASVRGIGYRWHE